MARHPTQSELQAGLGVIRESPDDEGVVEMIVRRPAVDAREVVEEGELDAYGLVGDRWGRRARHRAVADIDGETQLTLMNARAAALVAQDRDRWPLAGDQLEPRGVRHRTTSPPPPLLTLQHLVRGSAADI